VTTTDAANVTTSLLYPFPSVAAQVRWRHRMRNCGYMLVALRGPQLEWRQ
jgi:hypothetical protein